jgi:type II secretory pathway component GspD/PulD (secretin)
MRTRSLLLTAASALLVTASAVYAQAQPTPAAAPKPAVKEPVAAPVVEKAAPPAAPEVVIKDSDAHTAATKSKDATGRDTLSVDFPEEDIRNILRNVADLFELNIIIPEALQGKATIKLRDVTWRQIFTSVLSPVGFTYIEEGNIIKVVSNESLTQEPATTEVFLINYARAADILPTVSSLVDAAAGGKIVVDSRSNSLVITERPTRLNRIRPIIEQLDRATDQVMIESKFVEVTDRDVKNLGVNWASLQAYQLGAGNLNSTFSRTQGQQTSNGFNNSQGTNVTNNNSTNQTSTLTQITNPTNGSQVTSTNGVVTTTGTTGTNSSINNNNTSTTSADSGNGVTNAVNLLQSLTNSTGTQRVASAVFSASDFNIILSALQTQNNTKVVSNPTIVTLNNTEATINVGEEDPIPKYTYNQEHGSFEVAGFDYKPIGILLRVTPQVNARGYIKLTLAPEVSQKNGSTTFGGAGGASIPIIATRKAVTQVSLKDGYTMAIGGMLSTQGTKSQTKVPVLGSIPGLGRLFRSDGRDISVTNLIIFITAKSVSAEGAPVEQIINSDQLRQLHMQREELPGYRDGTDPFDKPMPVNAAASSKSGGK